MLVTANDFIDLVAQRGISVTPAQLSRWRANGLMLPVVQQPLGRGLGSVALYGLREIDRVVAIVGLLRRSRNLGKVRWALWLGGFEIGEAHLRADLMRAARLWNDVIQHLTRLLDRDDDNAVGRLINKLFLARSKDRFFNQTRKALGKDRFAGFFHDVAHIGAGTFDDIAASPEPNDSERRRALAVFDAGLGLKRARTDRLEGGQPILRHDYSDTLKRLASVLGGSDLVEIARETPIEDLAHARSEIVAILQTLGAANEALEASFGRGAFGLRRIALFLANTNQTSQALLILCWRLVGRDSILRGRTDEILAAPAQRQTSESAS